MSRDDRNVVRLEVEVPATAEQAWEAIATGAGLETWFVPARVEEREGGEIVTSHGDFGDSRGVVTAWEPPRRFAYEERDWNGGEPCPPWATEFLVEGRAGGTTVVRLASGTFGAERDWSDEIGPTREGWARGLDNLRIYLTHFAGLPVSSMWVQRVTPMSAGEAWEGLRAVLGLDGAAVGERVSAAEDAPPLDGVVEEATDDLILIRTERPGPGLFELTTSVHGGPTRLSVRGYLYGEGGRGTVARERAAWTRWLAARFPKVSAA